MAGTRFAVFALVIVESYTRTYTGRRSANEDALAANSELGLFVVADGMGGYQGGAIASNIAVATLVEFVQRHLDNREGTRPSRADKHLSLDENVVHVGIRTAHRAILAQRKAELNKMGSTLVTVMLKSGRAVIGHIGDSRVYRLRHRELELLTRDHSLYADLVAAGCLNGPPASFKWANVITRALGISDNPEVTSCPLRAGDLFLLCSDGLTGAVPDGDIREILSTLPLNRVCDTLVTEAYALGSQDNITAVVASVVAV